MNFIQRQELARKISFFLVQKGLNIWDEWQGRLNKKEQIDCFGFYLGKGLIVVNGKTDSIYMLKRVCFGQDIENARGITSQYHIKPAWDDSGKSQFREYCKSENIEVI